MLVNLRSVVSFRFVRVRWKLFALFNALFFSCISVTLVLSSLFLEPPLYSGWRPSIPELFLNGGWLVMILGIFVFNLAMSSFVFVTLPGFLFFPLSAGFLLYRAFLWGLLLYALPTRVFVVSLPTVLLEGEAYVCAAVAGTVVGASWAKPDWADKVSKLSRFEALKKALKECFAIYGAVAIVLFVAAIVETATIIFMASW